MEQIFEFLISFLNMADFVQILVIFVILSTISDIFPKTQKISEKFKNLFHRFFDTIQPLTQI